MQGTYVVVEADPGSAVLRDVDTAQVLTLAENPGVEAGEVVEAALEADDTGVTYTASVESRRDVAVERVADPPGERAVGAVRGAEPGELRVVEAADRTVHVLPVPEGRAAAAADEVAEDPATVERAARLGASRVEVRAGDGLVAVRYETDEAADSGR